MQKTGWIIALAVISLSSASASAKTRIGWVEEVRIDEVDLQVKAKMDTGAETSSVDAEIIDIVKTEKKSKAHTGEKVVFSIASEDARTKKTFERDIVRYVKIKKKGGGYIRRPVIEMTFCIAGKRVSEEVNLANRENFIYPVLVGRNMLADAGLTVDAAETFVSRPHCEPTDEKKKD